MDDAPAEQLLKRVETTWPGTRTPVGEAAVRLFRARDLVFEHSRRMIKREFGLTRAEFDVIVTLRTFHPPYRATPTQLWKSILITPGGMTKVLNNLEGKGLISRGDDSDDARSHWVMLTPDGVELAETVLPAVIEEYSRHFRGGLKASEVEQLSALLGKMLASLEPTDPESA